MKSKGNIKIHITRLLEERGLSRSEFCRMVGLRPAQLDRYCNNTMRRLDSGALDKMCAVLDCDIGDLLEYIPPDE